MIERVRSELELPALKIYLDETFGSKNPGHRMKIREAILALYPNEPGVLDLLEVPRLKSQHVSISHTQLIGGFVLNPAETPIGFDVELTSRVKASQLERVSRYENEVKLAPGPHFLWTAKEAAFKAMSNSLKLKVLSDLAIIQWTKLDPDFWRYDSDHFYGVSYTEGQFTISIARAR